MELDPTLRIVYVKRGTVPEAGAVWCFTHAVMRLLDWPMDMIDVGDVDKMDAKLTTGTFTCVDCDAEATPPDA